MRRKPRLVDKIAHGMSMFLSGPAPGFGLALGKLGKYTAPMRARLQSNKSADSEKSVTASQIFACRARF